MIKKYIKKILLELIQEDMKQTDLSNFIINLDNQESSVLQRLRFFDVTSIDLNIIYYDEINEKLDHKLTSSSIAEFRDKIVEYSMPTDVKAVEKVDFQVWYNYKGRQELQVKRFLGFGQRSDPLVLSKIRSDILQMFKENPELLL